MRQFSGTCAFHIGRRRFLGPVRKFRTVPPFIAEHIPGKGENLPKKRWVLGASLLALVAAISITAVAIGQSSAQPANKAFAGASKTMKTGPAADIVLLTQTVKNSKPTDMILQVSMECSIITDAVIAGSTVPGA